MAIPHGSVADHLHVLPDVARRDADRLLRRVRAGDGDDGVKPGPLGHESPVRIDVGDGARFDDRVVRLTVDGVANRVVGDCLAVSVLRHRLEVNHVAGASRLDTGLEGEGHDRIFHDLDLDAALDAFGLGLEHRLARLLGSHVADRVDLRDVRIATREADLDVEPLRLDRVANVGLDGDDGAGVERTGQPHERHLLDWRLRNRDGDLGAEQRLRSSARVFWILRHERHDLVLARTVRLHLAGRVDAGAAASARVEDDLALEDHALVVLDYGRQGRLLADLQGQLLGRDLEGLRGGVLLLLVGLLTPGAARQERDEGCDRQNVQDLHVSNSLVLVRKDLAEDPRLRCPHPCIQGGRRRAILR